MRIYNHILDTIERSGAFYFVLLDPDKINNSNLIELIHQCERMGVDGFLIGGSLMMNSDFEKTIDIVKNNSKLPAVIFPGDVNQISPKADAILFLSLISSRNAEQIIGKQVLAAPIIKNYNLETISTGYILVESGNITTAEYMSGSKPIPRNKPEIAVATALAAEYMGMKFVYLEAGSGAENPVPNEMIKQVVDNCSLPIIVGGGIRNSKIAREKVESGAKIIVTGNFFEENNNWNKIKEFAEAIHFKNK